MHRRERAREPLEQPCAVVTGQGGDWGAEEQVRLRALAAHLLTRPAGAGGVVSCVTRAFCGLLCPKPKGGIVTVNYPIVFAPKD